KTDPPAQRRDRRLAPDLPIPAYTESTRRSRPRRTRFARGCRVRGVRPERRHDNPGKLTEPLLIGQSGSAHSPLQPPVCAAHTTPDRLLSSPVSRLCRPSRHTGALPVFGQPANRVGWGAKAGPTGAATTAVPARGPARRGPATTRGA